MALPELLSLSAVVDEGPAAWDTVENSENLEAAAGFGEVGSLTSFSEIDSVMLASRESGLLAVGDFGLGEELDEVSDVTLRRDDFRIEGDSGEGELFPVFVGDWESVDALFTRLAKEVAVVVPPLMWELEILLVLVVDRLLLSKTGDGGWGFLGKLGL